MKMLTLFSLFDLYGIDKKSLKLVRHSSDDIFEKNDPLTTLELFRKNRKKFESYQSFQKEGTFRSAAQIAVFAKDKKTSGLFLGIWDIKGCISNQDLSKEIRSEIDTYSFPGEWKNKSAYYLLQYNNIMEDMSERLLIEWGRGTVAWVQSQDKEILEIRGRNSIGDFKSYDNVLLTYDELKRIFSNPGSNITWLTALSKVRGIYLIREKTFGKLYVGSAYGKDSISRRWENYAKNGHGGNKELKGYDPCNFEFSILEIVSWGISNAEIIEKETQWKVKLGTRKFGLNCN